MGRPFAHYTLSAGALGVDQLENTIDKKFYKLVYKTDESLPLRNAALFEGQASFKLKGIIILSVYTRLYQGLAGLV